MTPLTVGSFFSGIGGFDLGFERAGFSTVFASEVKPFALAVYYSHWPDVPNIGDLNAVCPFGVGPNHTCDIPKATVWTGGFPCSDVTLLGVQRGLRDGRRSSLALVWLDVADRHRPPWCIFENVPGLLSSREGKDFAEFLGTLAELGYGWSYRLLDTRHFGLPQSRRRLVIVAGPSASAAGAVLDDSTPRRLAVAPLGGQGPALAGRGSDGAGTDCGDVRTLVVGPKYSVSGDSRSITRTNYTFPVTPGNFQYVLEAGPQADAAGVRTAPRLPDWLDDPDGGDGESLWPERLDNARWHVLGRAFPPPLAQWVADGLRTVIERLDVDPGAYDD